MDSSIDFLDVYASDADSELSDLSRSPSPPEQRYPLTPPSSHPSSPTPEISSRKRASPNANSESPPAKRRRVTESMPRETKHLDLDALSNNLDSENTYELERLVKALQSKRKIVVVAGAGISVSAGSESRSPFASVFS